MTLPCSLTCLCNVRCRGLTFQHSFPQSGPQDSAHQQHQMQLSLRPASRQRRAVRHLCQAHPSRCRVVSFNSLTSSVRALCLHYSLCLCQELRPCPDHPAQKPGVRADVLSSRTSLFRRRINLQSQERVVLCGEHINTLFRELPEQNAIYDMK